MSIWSFMSIWVEKSMIDEANVETEKKIVANARS